MQVVHYLPDLWLRAGGIVRAVFDWCQALSAAGLRMCVATCVPGDVPPEWGQGAAANPRVLQVPGLLGGEALLSSAGLGQVEAVLDRDTVIHLHGPWLPANLQLAALARRRGVPYVLTTHGMLDDWSMAQKALKKRVYYHLFARRLLADAACIHCTAEAELAQARRWLPAQPRQTAVIPCLLDLAEFLRPADPAAARALLPDWRDDRPTVLFLSRLHPKKGVELLIAATRLLRERGQDVQVVIAGPGEDDYVARLRRQVDADGVADRVRLVGMVQGEAKVALYQSADVFVLPTAQENFGLVLVEALASGTPVITTRGVDIWQELAGACMPIVAHDPAALAGAMADLLADRARGAALGEQGRAWVTTWLSPQRLVSAYQRLYADVLAARS